MKVFLTNLGKYNEGYLVGEWLELPATDELISDTLDRIGINAEYEEFFITDYEDSPVKINEFDNIKKLNFLAEKFESLSDTDQKILEYLLNYENLGIDEALTELEKGNYTYYSDVEDEESLGHAIAEDWTIPEYLLNYIDYEAIGRDFTCSGWVLFETIAICRA